MKTEFNYIPFDLQQNKYENGDNESFYPNTLDKNCFSRHILINRYIVTKKPKYLFWALEHDPNVLMDPFFVETITYWVNQKLNNPRNNLLDSQLNNVGEALKNSRNNNNFFHYDSGYVHSYCGEEPLITFEVHPPRRCYRIIDNFNLILNFIDKEIKDNSDLGLAVNKKFQIDISDIEIKDYNLIAAKIISSMHNRIKKVENDKLILTPEIAYAIYEESKIFVENLQYIVDTFRIVDYWDPDKKR